MNEANITNHEELAPDGEHFFDTGAVIQAQPVVPLEQIQEETTIPGGRIHVPVSPEKSRFSNTFLLVALLTVVTSGSVLSALFYISSEENSSPTTAAVASVEGQFKPNTEKPPVISKNTSTSSERKIPRSKTAPADSPNEPVIIPVDAVYEEEEEPAIDEVEEIKEEKENKKGDIRPQPTEDKKQDKISRKLKNVERGIRIAEQIFDNN